MIDYHELNRFIILTVREPILVIYKEGTKTREELIGLSKLKSFSFYSDKTDLLMKICGLRLGGIIVEDDADFNYYNLRYALTRLDDDKLIFSLNDAHKERLEDILEQYCESSENTDLIEELRKSIIFVKL